MFVLPEMNVFYHKEHINHSFHINFVQVTPEQLKKSLDVTIKRFIH